MGSISQSHVFPLDVEGSGLSEDNIRTQSDHEVMIKNITLLPGMPEALAMRLLQFCIAASSIVVWANTSYIRSFTIIRYLVAALSLQCLWSLSLAIVDIYALMVKRFIRNLTILAFVIIGDAITLMLTLAGVAIIYTDDIEYCANNHCTRFGTSIGLAFVSCFLVVLSCFAISTSPDISIPMLHDV